MQKSIHRFLFVLIVGLLLAACQSKLTPESELTVTEQLPAGGPSLTGTVWKWVGFTDPLQSITIDHPERYTVQFNSDGTMNIQADCNNGTAQYNLNGSSIQIEMGRMTLMACEPGGRSDAFLQNLSVAAIYFFKGDELYIDLKMDSGTMQFRQ